MKFKLLKQQNSQQQLEEEGEFLVTGENENNKYPFTYNLINELYLVNFKKVVIVSNGKSVGSLVVCYTNEHLLKKNSIVIYWNTKVYKSSLNVQEHLNVIEYKGNFEFTYKFVYFFCSWTIVKFLVIPPKSNYCITQ